MGGEAAMSLHFRVEGTPTPQGSMRSYGHGIMVSDNPRLHAWRDMVTLRAKEAMRAMEPFAGAVDVTLVFTLPRPKSVSVAKRPMHTVKPDLDKLVRACFDALTSAGAWRDDAAVVRVTAIKCYESRGQAVGCEVWVCDAEAVRA